MTSLDPIIAEKNVNGLEKGLEDIARSNHRIETMLSNILAHFERGPRGE